MKPFYANQLYYEKKRRTKQLCIKELNLEQSAVILARFAKPFCTHLYKQPRKKEENLHLGAIRSRYLNQRIRTFYRFPLNQFTFIKPFYFLRNYGGLSKPFPAFIYTPGVGLNCYHIY